MPQTEDHPQATLHAALRAIAAARPIGSALALVILTLLLRLLASTEAAWFLSPDDEYSDDDEVGAPLYALIPRAIGRAPHAACIEAGLVPDWILPGIRNRGMRPAARPARRRPRALPARAPPAAHPLPC